MLEMLYNMLKNIPKYSTPFRDRYPQNFCRKRMSIAQEPAIKSSILKRKEIACFCRRSHGGSKQNN